MHFHIESSKILKISGIFEDLNNLHEILEIPKKILKVLKKDQEENLKDPRFLFRQMIHILKKFSRQDSQSKSLHFRALN